MIGLHSKSYMFRFSGSLFINIKAKANENFHVAAMLLFYIVQKCYLDECRIFFRCPLKYLTLEM
jgi:hypothetical protein